MNRYPLSPEPSHARRRTFYVLWAVCLVLGMGTFTLASDPQRTIADAFNRASAGDMTPEEIARTVEDLLQSEDPAVAKGAVRMAAMGGRRLAGNLVVDKLRAYFHEAPDADTKYAVVDALATIADPQSRAFFSELLRTGEPVSSRIEAIRYLMGDMDLRRDEAEAAFSSLLEGLAFPAGGGQRRRPLESRMAWATLSDLVHRYQLPAIEPTDSTPEARASAAAEWWQREREAVIQRFPKGPRLLKIGRPTPHAVYDWDEGIALICELIVSSDETASRKGMNMAIEAGDRLSGTPVVQRLETVSTRPSDDPPAAAMGFRRRAMLALAAIHDPRSRAWFVKHLDPSQHLILRLLAADHLSASVKPSEANAVIQVVCDAVKVPDEDPFYQHDRMRKGMRTMVAKVLGNIANVMRIPKLEVDWHQNGDARAESVREWWGGTQTQPAP